jgi:hypothetical protein
MAKQDDYFSSGKPCNDRQMHGVKTLHGTPQRETHLTGKSVEANTTVKTEGYEGSDAE